MEIFESHYFGALVAFFLLSPPPPPPRWRAAVDDSVVYAALDSGSLGPGAARVRPAEDVTYAEVDHGGQPMCGNFDISTIPCPFLSAVSP